MAKKIRFAKGYRDAVPVFLQEYREEEGKGVFQVRQKGFWARFFFWLFRKPTEGKVFLDEMGTRALSYVDGLRSIKEIADLMVKNGEGENPEDLSQRLALFFGGLHQRQFIEFQRP